MCKSKRLEQQRKIARLQADIQKLKAEKQVIRQIESISLECFDEITESINKAIKNINDEIIIIKSILKFAEGQNNEKA